MMTASTSMKARSEGNRDAHQERRSLLSYKWMVFMFIVAIVAGSLRNGRQMQTNLAPLLQETHAVAGLASNSHPSSTVPEDSDGKLPLSELATNIVWQRKTEYELRQRAQTFFIRGIGYLYLQQKIVLAAVPQFVGPNERIQVDVDGQPDAEAFDEASSSMKPGINEIKIYNVYNSELIQTQGDESGTSSSSSSSNASSTAEANTHRRRLQQSASSAPQQRQNEELRNDCFRLTIWVRVLGPEIIAGSAVAINATDTSSCHWEFPFDLQIAGRYEIDAKILMWDAYNAQQADCALVQLPNEGKNALLQGRLDVLGPRFQMADNNTAHGQARPGVDEKVAIISDGKIIHQGFKGFKLYRPHSSCCEICTRMKPYCIYFLSIPLYLPSISRANNGCELFYRPDTPDEHILTSHIFRQPAPHRKIIKSEHVTTDDIVNATASVYPSLEDAGNIKLYHGEPHDVPTVLFLGCGWSNWHTLDFACLSGEKDDQVYTPYKFFTFDPESHSEQTPKVKPKGDDPSALHTEDELPLCKLEDENVDFNPYHRPGRWVRLDFNDTSLCPVPFRFDSMHNDKSTRITEVIPDHPRCWHRDDFREFGDLCIEQNCGIITESSKWRSSLHKESQFMGVWRNYKCDYQEFTTSQLQQCITKRKISSITTRGQSMSGFFMMYLKHRLKGIQFYTGENDGLSVILHTAAYVHQIRDPMVAFMRSSNKPFQFPVVSNLTEIYWASGQYLSSERDTNVHLGRAVARHPAIGKVLNEKKGYKMLNFFDLTAAFTYDTAGQHDGLHIGGPAMKGVIIKLFHHMCGGVIEGSRM